MWEKFKGAAITQLNIIATLILTWIAQNPTGPLEPVVNVFPESVQPLVRIVFPVVWGLVVQVAIAESKKHAVAKATDAA